MTLRTPLAHSPIRKFNDSQEWYHALEAVCRSGQTNFFSSVSTICLALYLNIGIVAITRNAQHDGDTHLLAMFATKR